MAKVIAVANQKGGVGKTTLTFNLAAALGAIGHRLLLVDNDPQGNLTTYAGVERAEGQVSLDELYLKKDASLLRASQLVQVKANLHLIPSDPMLAGVEYYLLSRPQKDQILSKHLEQVSNDFDFIIVDNPPSLNLLTINGLMAADSILVPVQPEFFSLEGISQLHATVDDLKRLKPSLKFLGFVPNLFDERRKLNVEAIKSLEQAYPDMLFETRIHNSVKIPESSGHGRPVLEYSPRSRSAGEFMSLAKEVLKRI